ncbi:O-antigen ligase family protein [Neiella marina]|uniref:O-antigen ligase family protein n=1 Tax=Neiella holothuriorum TaxID=2870530 RepID=A0ABS7EI77_9GAMM|nr:O-antigen ligase family protein [Neiella holothuriorum]MBW8191456.1 O-antigen ligase family protein [Neiella holothuriorum]
MLSNAMFYRFVCATDANYSLNNRLAVLLITVIAVSCFDLLTLEFATAELEDLDLSNHAADTSSGTMFNQVFWLSLFGLSGFMVLRNPVQFRKLLFAQTPLVVLAVLALASATWALAPDIAGRRAILQIIVIFSVFVGVCYLKTPYQAPLIFYRVATAALAMNLLAIGLGCFDKDGYFYGIHGHKNILGATALIALFLGVAVRHLYAHQIYRSLNNAYLLIWLMLLVISMSKTSMGLCVLVPSLVIGSQLVARTFNVNLGILLLFMMTVIALGVVIVMSMHDLHLQGFAGLFLADASFTGRDYIWAFLLEQIDQRWLLGHGYGSFWGIGLDSPNIRHGRGFLTLLNQGHNGYLDLLAILGWVGMACYLWVLQQFASQSGRIRRTQPALFSLCWMLLVLTLLHNVTESSILRGYSALWVIQLIVFALVARAAIEKEEPQ